MNIQMIDEFRRRTNASYDEAKYYLDRCNGDLLEAIIAFEKERTGYQTYTCRDKKNDYGKSYQDNYQNGYQSYGAPHSRSGNLGRGIMRVLQRLIDIKLVITDKSLRTFNIPLLVPVVLFPVWHIIIVMAIVMMIMGFRFSFQEIPDTNVNVESFVGKMKDKVKENTRSF